MSKKKRVPSVRKYDDKDVRSRAVPSSNHEAPVFLFTTMDCDGPWGLRRLMGADLCSAIFPKLRNFETMTWANIIQQSGGGSSGTNSHPVKVASLASDAKKRLAEISQDDVEELFSLRLDGRKRIWGKREGRTLKILWYDPKHEVCPSTTR